MQLRIAEVKTHSPFGWETTKTWLELLDIAKQIGHMISIHTDHRWHGSFDLISEACELTDIPILAKGVHPRDSDITRALNAGASRVLVVGRTPEVEADKCLIEPCTLEQLAALPSGTHVVWNSRDLNTGGLKKETFAEAREAYDGWLCQASNICCLADIDPRADAVLIGTHLPDVAAEILSRSLTR